MEGDVVLRAEPLNALHLCSGYGGFELGLRLAGVPARTVAHVERDAYAAATLVARMEEAHLDLAPVWSDLTTFDARPWRGRVDLVTAGFPCQPFSSAGQQRGTDDERWLWPAIGRIIGDLGPRLVFLENVPGLVRAGLPHVLADLARLGFDAEWGLLSASEVGAPHRRERFWLLAYADSEVGRRPQGDALCGDSSSEAGRGAPQPRRLGRRVADSVGEQRLEQVNGHGAGQSDPAWCFNHAWPPGRDDHDGWRNYLAAGGPEPAVRRSADGRPAELADALHAGGNGLVPAVAARAFVELARRLSPTLSALFQQPSGDPMSDLSQQRLRHQRGKP